MIRVSSGTAVTLKFDKFVLDTSARRLLSGDREVHLSPKAFDLLQLLISRRPNAVSKAAIQDALWPSTHVVEANVANLAGEVRRALEDNRMTPRFIRMVPRFGYVFIHPVSDDEQRAAFSLVWRGMHYDLRPGTNILGRTTRDGSPFNSETISRQHACIVVDGLAVTVRDLGSRNGTFVNGTRATGSIPLRAGDIVRLGAVHLTFCLDASDCSTQLLPEL
jgi:DNA-binding winged helix-turn-helix (wHTH) protein